MLGGARGLRDGASVKGRHASAGVCASAERGSAPASFRLDWSTWAKGKASLSQITTFIPALRQLSLMGMGVGKSTSKVDKGPMSLDVRIIDILEQQLKEGWLKTGLRIGLQPTGGTLKSMLSPA